MSLIKSSNVAKLVLSLAVAAMMSACGMDHSPMASSADESRIAQDQVSAPAAKQATESAPEESTSTKGKKASEPTLKKGPSRYSLGK